MSICKLLSFPRLFVILASTPDPASLIYWIFLGDHLGVFFMKSITAVYLDTWPFPLQGEEIPNVL